ncbi:heparinase II/III family protein [Ornithinimicrobium sp. LYQ92]|uniref:heparinase II/III domain-containing protein n=1 Tax=Serinicoccus sp. LYQ92 TaxID=3378798 RepID=UPI003852CA61
MSTRQAFGAVFQRPKNLDSLLDSYRAGQLRLPPQPVWTGEFTNWAADPFEDRNWRFQHHTLRWLNPIRWAALDGVNDARGEWLYVARSWAETNIPAEESPSDFAWKDMADGTRAIQFCLGAPLVGPEDEWFVELLKYHRDWLMDDKHIVQKNHALHQHQGLLVLGATLRDTDAINKAVERMRTQFRTTFDEQGGNDEGAIKYHELNIQWWALGWRRVEAEGIAPPEDVQHRLDRAAYVLAHMTLPNGEITQIGDTVRGKVAPRLGEATEYAATGGRSGKTPSERVVVLDRGYILSRSGWGEKKPLDQESHTVIRHGIHHRGHAHQDRGSVHIYAAGQRWLTDSGFHSYQAGSPEVRYLKSREAHNVAFLPGVDHDDNAPVEIVAQHVSDDAHDFTLLDHGYGDADVRRRVIYLTGPDAWLVIDTADPAAGAPIRQHWHVELDTKVRVLDNGYRLAGARAQFTMYWLGRGTALSHRLADDRSHDAWIGTRWKTMQPSARITAESRARSPRLVTLLVPQAGNPLGVVSSHVATTGTTSLDLVRGGARWRIKVTDGELVVRQS